MPKAARRWKRFSSKPRSSARSGWRARPWVNHSWHATFYVFARGLTTAVLHHGGRAFDIEFDFVDEVVAIRTADGRSRALKLRAKPVSVFYRDVLEALAEVGLAIDIDRKPNEVAVAVPFPADDEAGDELRARVRAQGRRRARQAL